MPGRAATTADIEHIMLTIRDAFADDPVWARAPRRSVALGDAAGVPACLESTNVVDNHRHRRAGFVEDGGYKAVRDDSWITAMWRSVGGR